MDIVRFYKDAAGDWRWRRTADNGEIIGASTEGYVQLSHAVDNFTRLQKKTFELQVATDEENEKASAPF